MNYYKQGDAAKADKIKAAFEEKGYSDKGFTFDVNDILFFTANNKHINVCPANGWLANIIKTHPDYQELELPIETKSKFNVGDWIVCWNRTYQIIDNKSTYIVREINSLETRYEHSTVDENGHLWTIKDAKDGDVLATDNGWTCIFKAFDGYGFSSYCFMDSQKWFCEVGAEGHTLDSRINGNIHPATKEQRDIFFHKMKEAGYQWDSDNKELHKIQPHYDITNFKSFDKVLVRDTQKGTWKANFFSRYKDEKDDRISARFLCVESVWIQCIPFEGNEHLLGTTDMPSEEYINW